MPKACHSIAGVIVPQSDSARRGTTGSVYWVADWIGDWDPDWDLLGFLGLVMGLGQ